MAKANKNKANNSNKKLSKNTNKKSSKTQDKDKTQLKQNQSNERTSNQRRSTTYPEKRSKPKIRPTKLILDEEQEIGAFQSFFGRHHWLAEISSITMILISAFISLSFLSGKFYPDDGNLLGPIGKVTATLLSGFMGWSIFLPLIIFLGLALHIWGIASEEDQDLSLKINSFLYFLIGTVALSVTSAVLFAIKWGAVGGGDIGNSIALPLVKFTNVAGAYMITGVFAVIALSSIFQKSTKDVMQHIFVSLINSVTYLMNIFIDFVALSFNTSVNLFSKVFSKDYEEEDEEEEEVRPKPKLRKNRIGNSIQAIQEIEENIDSRDITHVLVSRRKAQKGASKKASGTLQVRAKNNQIGIAAKPYVPPSLNLLSHIEQEVSVEDDNLLRQKSLMIEQKLKDFGILGRVTEVHPGPVITLFEFEPAPGVKVGKIAALQDDLAMSLKANSIRIIAPLPRKGTVGIEVPNKNREMVQLRDVIESDAFVNATSLLTVAIGKDTYGDPIVVDIAQMPHLLVAGATGTGKSVAINTLLLSLLYRCTPDELGLILIDPKILELSVYDGIPHLKVPVVTVPKQAKAVLEWAVHEMDKRYRLMQRFGVRSIKGYNQLIKGEIELAKEERLTAEKVNPKDISEIDFFADENEEIDQYPEELNGKNPDLKNITREKLEPLSNIVIVIDELADLMLSVGKDIEDLIARLAQKARAAGIHLIVATQRPSVDVITGLIKANFPARISFRVSSRVDSRTILDYMGAEKLLGRGDMLYMLPGQIHIARAHGAFVSDEDVKSVIDAIKKQSEPNYDADIIKMCEAALKDDYETSGTTMDGADYDSLYDQAVQFVLEKGAASTSLLQRAFRIGYNRAARIIDLMEQEGIIGPVNGAKPREILVNGYESGDYQAE